ncbi:NAD(P)-dependent alcohol dehydrogenase [Parasphingorhabdus sp.]|uniref:NAD(P)-dependent alcohol dehydrogenase n=1 Tax=Parasphingorhabdus sp. TaxID=2709688 RepID=UPI0032EC3A3D
MKIQAAIVAENGGAFNIRDVEVESPRDDEVLVKIVGVGVCHTDLVCRDQYFPVPLPCVFGHEGSGVVEAVGANVTKVAPGDHVVLTYKSCGKCVNCLKGAAPYCLDLYGQNFAGHRPDGSNAHSCDGETVHGHFFQQSSFATHALAHEQNTVKVDKSAPLELLGPLGCGIQTGAGAVMNSLRPRAGEAIAVFGAGSVGLSAIMAARVVGCSTIIAVDLNEKRLELARELGATHTFNGNEDGVVDKIVELTGGGVDFSLECTGLPSVARQAVDCLILTGTCGIIGVAPLGTEIALDMNGILFGRSVRGIIEGDSDRDVFIPRLVELHRQGRFPFDRLVRFYPLSEIQQAVEDTERGDVLKAILRP